MIKGSLLRCLFNRSKFALVPRQNLCARIKRSSERKRGSPKKSCAPLGIIHNKPQPALSHYSAPAKHWQTHGPFIGSETHTRRGNFQPTAVNLASQLETKVASQRGSSRFIAVNAGPLAAAVYNKFSLFVVAAQQFHEWPVHSQNNCGMLAGARAARVVAGKNTRELERAATIDLRLAHGLLAKFTRSLSLVVNPFFGVRKVDAATHSFT